jgi:Fic family protein
MAMRLMVRALRNNRREGRRQGSESRFLRPDTALAWPSCAGPILVFVLEQEDPELFDRVQEQNLNRQYELLTNCIEIGLKKGPTAFDKYMLWALNHVAVANISQFGGRFREEPIYVGDHKPPHFKEVSHWMDRFISTVQENWYVWSPTELAAYALWKFNWIHPFIEGNGRTARATCYYLLCTRSEALLPGRRIVPDRA